MLTLFLIGAAAGILGGLLGIGGGAVVVPGLVFAASFDQHKAHGTSLLAVIMLAVSGVTTYSLHGHIDWLLALEIAAGGVVGAAIGAKAAAAIKAPALRRVFSIFLLFVGVRMILGGCQGEAAVTSAQQAAAGQGSSILLVTASGLAAGFLSSLLGIGGGMVMVPAMVLLLCVDQHTAQAVSLAAIVPTAATGMLMHRAMGNVDLRVGFIVGLGAVAGAFGGASTASSVGTTQLKLIFGAFLIIMSVIMALKKPPARQAAHEAESEF